MFRSSRGSGSGSSILGRDMVDWFHNTSMKLSIRMRSFLRVQDQIILGFATVARGQQDTMILRK